VRRCITCREFVEFLDDYIAGVLPAERREEFNDHLSGCPPCVTYFESYRETVQLGRAVLGRTSDPVPEGVPEDLVKAILAARDKT